MKSQSIQREDFTLRIITLGQSGTGKTSIINRYFVISKKENFFSNQHTVTLGVDYKQKILVAKNYTVNLQIWDTAGQQRFRTITRQYYHGSHGIALVYDVTDRQSFEKVAYWLEQIKNQNVENPLIILLGNKIDMEIHRKVSQEEGERLAKFYNLNYFEVSAKFGTSVEEVFEFAVDKIILQLRGNSDWMSRSNESSIISYNRKKLEKKNCCS